LTMAPLPCSRICRSSYFMHAQTPRRLIAFTRSKIAAGSSAASLGGLVGLPGRVAYHASKHGVLGLTKSAALEYASRGVRINAVCPGTIDTPMVAAMEASGELDMAEALRNQPIGRLGTADEIAAAVLWLCSPGASFVVGIALPVDGGYTAG